MRKRYFVLDERVMEILRSKGLLPRFLRCRFCGRRFRIGDRIFSVARGGKRRAWYCLECAKRFRMWLGRD
jgi:recombinational DNA repair protein (RecF pathway)